MDDKTRSGSLCGLGSYRPEWLQRYATTNYFLLVYGLLGTIQSMAYVYWVATLTTFESRFRIPSRTTGIMLSGNEISQILLSLLLTYYGGQRNRPLWIAWGVAFSAASCYVLALPHFLYGPGDTALALTQQYMDTHSVNTSLMAQQEKNGLCSASKTAENCGTKTGGEYSQMPAILVFLSQFILGIGSTLYFALGQTYIDDNAKKTKTPFLLGVTMSLRTIGPAFGFLVGYACLSLYIDPSLTPLIGKKDPRWLGAWWLGWLLLGTAMFLFALLMSLFPKNIRRSSSSSKKKTEEINENVVGEKPPALNGGSIVLELNDKADLQEVPLSNGEAAQNRVPNGVSADVADKGPKPATLKEFPAALKRLISNKILVVNIFAGVFYILGGSGYITYLTKYLEVQFYNTAANASLVVGPTTLLSFVLGFLVSGIVISKYRPRPVLLLGWNVVVGALFVLAEILFIFISCADNNIVGYDSVNRSVNLLNECNAGCGCTNLKYAPVCLVEANLTFYTACHAGCKTITKLNGTTTYSNCSCIPGDEVQLSWSNDSIDQYRYSVFSGEVRDGLCPVDCGYNFVLFIVLSFIMHSFGSSGKIGNILVNYRAVHPEDKAFGQGLALLLISLLAFIPGPIIFGAIIDSACLIWDKSCGTTGNCLFYDKQAFRFRLNITGAGFTLVGVILDAVVCYLGTDLDLYSEDQGTCAKHNSEKSAVERREPPALDLHSDSEEGPLKYKYLEKKL